MDAQPRIAWLKRSWKVLLLLGFLVLVALSYRFIQAGLVDLLPSLSPFSPTSAAPAVALGLVGQTVQPTTAADPPGLAFFKTLHEHGDGYDLVVHYPYLQDPEDPSAEAFDRSIESFVRRLADSFIGSTHADAKYPTNMTADYRVLYDQDGLISLYYEITTVSAGSAHPGNSSIVYNYSRQLNRDLRLADLFQPGAGYLQVLSAYCTGTLKNDGRLVFEKGAKPFQENFRKWNITPEGLLITFDPYQVAPYSAGYVQVNVPYTVVAPILDLHGPLASLISH